MQSRVLPCHARRTGQLQQMPPQVPSKGEHCLPTSMDIPGETRHQPVMHHCTVLLPEGQVAMQLVGSRRSGYAIAIATKMSRVSLQPFLKMIWLVSAVTARHSAG